MIPGEMQAAAGEIELDRIAKKKAFIEDKVK